MDILFFDVLGSFDNDCCIRYVPLGGDEYDYTEKLTTNEHVEQSLNFLEPLFQRDRISNDGTWNHSHTLEALPFTREQWLCKIAQELREGKI